MKFSPHIETVQFPPITKVRSWLQGRDLEADRPLVDFCQAIPDYPPAPELADHLRGLVDEPRSYRYSPDEGLQEVRALVGEWYGRRYGSAPALEEICLTIGASQAFWLAINLLCQAGDNVIVPLPAYFDHPMALQSLGIECNWVPFGEEGCGTPGLEKIAARINARTRAILLVSPSNPTGAVTPAETLLEIYHLARKHGVALVVDETYHAFLPSDQPPHRLFEQPDWQETFIHLGSFGKTFALTGYRAGALIAGPKVIHHALKLQDSMVVCQPGITQQAVAYGCRHLDEWVVQKAAMMQRRHDLFCEHFAHPDNPFRLVASGGFFAWVRHPWPQSSGRDVARTLVEQANLICLPGEAFGPGLEPYLRLAFGNLPEKAIPGAVQRFLNVTSP